MLSVTYHRAGLTFRGARGILSARGPFTPPPPPNGMLDTEFNKIKKYSVVFHTLKNFRLYLEKKKELYINNLIESEIQPS